MARKPKHELSEDDRYKGQIGSRESAGLNGRMRQKGMFIDAAGFIMAWRNDDGKGHPPIAKLVRFLRQRGWTGERGGELSRTEVSRMLTAMDPTGSAIPANKAEWDAIQKGSVEPPPDIEIVSTVIDPKAWIEMRTAMANGWKPSWREQTLKATDDHAEAELLKEALSRPPVKRSRPRS
jgi:hypothetical protein